MEDKKQLREWVISEFYKDLNPMQAISEYQLFERLNHICNWIETGNYETAE